MWIPRDYADVTRAIGYLSEGEQLDFKLPAARPADSQDLAKDVAAMSLVGGVIVIGVDETDGLATRVEPFTLAGQPERIQQIIDARVQPTPSVRIELLRAQPADADGVLAIVVMPSTSAPHMVGDRFPARSGATTRYLSEREVADWYDRRRALRERAAARIGMADFVAPPDGEQQPPQGVGRMRLRVRPALDVAHPDEPRLRSPLTRANRDAAGTLASFVRSDRPPASLSWLREWAPRGSTGWAAGQAGTANITVPFENQLVAGAYIYGEGFSFQVVIGLVPPGVDFWVAYEHLWLAEAMALLSLAGHFFADLPLASPLRCDLELVGLAGGLSFTQSYHEPHGFLNQPEVPRVTDAHYERGESFQARDLVDDPRHAAGSLLDRLLASIVPEHVNLLERIAP